MYGLTDEQLGSFFGVSRATISNYKNEHPEFLDTLKKGKLIADTGVIDSLYKRATGFTFEEISQEGIDDGNGGIKIKSVRKTKKYYAPDPLSCFYWLNNRMKEQWRQRIQEIEKEEDEENNLSFDGWN